MAPTDSRDPPAVPSTPAPRRRQEQQQSPPLATPSLRRPPNQQQTTTPLPPTTPTLRLRNPAGAITTYQITTPSALLSARQQTRPRSNTIPPNPPPTRTPARPAYLPTARRPPVMTPSLLSSPPPRRELGPPPPPAPTFHRDFENTGPIRPPGGMPAHRRVREEVVEEWTIVEDRPRLLFDTPARRREGKK